MGVKSPQNEFQWAMFENFGDIKNVLSIIDDMIVYEFKEDDQVLNELLQRARGKEL